MPEFRHAIEHVVAALHRVLGVFAWVIERGRLDHCRKQRGFVNPKLCDVMPKEVIGCSPGSVGTLTEVHGVEVSLEDPSLRVLTLDFDRNP